MSLKVCTAICIYFFLLCNENSVRNKSIFKIDINDVSYLIELDFLSRFKSFQTLKTYKDNSTIII